MPITCKDLNAFSSRITANTPDETDIRAAISRSYYAAFHAVLPFVERLPDSAKCRPNATHVTHVEMTERLKEWRTAGVHSRLAKMTATGEQLASAIQTARTAREKADYRLGAQVLPGEAATQIGRAKKVMLMMAQLENEINRP
ncbi:hypothetical protein ACFFGH_06395 [Lysobacter korlensis]|uniref:Uncharacterized protein n=1 Tax=Lysobacter korlensis TaxID=553636 RepID=A0ABV6RKI5_9GAMM